MKAKFNQDIRNKMYINQVNQKELAAALGVTQGAISQMLSKTPLSDAERARLMNGINKAKNNCHR